VIFASSICGFSIGTSLGEVTNLLAEDATIPSWSGFSEDFNPDWAGETMRLNWSRGGSGGTYIYNLQPTPWKYVPPKPTELLSSSRSVASESRAYVSAGGKSATADSSNDYRTNSSTSDSGSWHSTLARYAQVIDLDDYVLGRAISLASIDSDISDSSYTLTSRIQTGGIIDPIVSSNSLLSSYATAEFAASYRVRKNSQFVLNGLFAGSSGLSAQLTITNQTTGEIFYEQSLAGLETDTGMKHFSLRGEVTPGVYDFNLVTSSQNEMTPYEIIKQGEIGELSLDFNWIPWGEGAGDFNNNGVVGAEDLALWQGAFGLRDHGDVDRDGDVDVDDYNAWYFSADVQDVNGDGFVGWIDDFSAWIGVERPGDANGDRNIDGRDFLIWQRTYTSPVASAAQSRSVPEPNTALLFSFAICACLIRGRKS
jgi:hypothetical protein